MANENFIDYVKINCRSGHGGAGSAHLRREKFVPKGGPDGGNGGRGGHVIVRGNQQMWTLLHLKYQKHIKAENGDNGSKSNSSGKNGEDKVIEVPIGTIVRNTDSGKIEFEVNKHGEEHTILPGGRGGMGNSHFKSSTHQTPRFAQSGEEGQEEWKILELKLLADVGLVGFPNAGKSTLLSVLSAAKPEIADYPFTTTTPNLGMIQYYDERSFVMADIPGIIEGAGSGKGLGHRFLRHIERNPVLLLCIPSDSDDIQKEYDVLLSELEAYDPELLQKKRILAVTKSDILDAELKQALSEELPKGITSIFISSLAETGLQKLKDLLWQTIDK